MKKILTVSLMAVMAVSAARAEIASTAYVDEKTGDLATLSTDEKTSLTAAVNELAGDIESISGENGVLSNLDLTQVAEEGKPIVSVSQVDGQVSASVGQISTVGIVTYDATKPTVGGLVKSSSLPDGYTTDDNNIPTLAAAYEITTNYVGDQFQQKLDPLANSVGDMETLDVDVGGEELTVVNAINAVVGSVDGVAKGTDATIANDGVYVLTATVKEGKVESYYWELIDRGDSSSAN